MVHRCKFLVQLLELAVQGRVYPGMDVSVPILMEGVTKDTHQLVGSCSEGLQFAVMYMELCLGKPHGCKDVIWDFLPIHLCFPSLGPCPSISPQPQLATVHRSCSPDCSIALLNHHLGATNSVHQIWRLGKGNNCSPPGLFLKPPSEVACPSPENASPVVG